MKPGDLFIDQYSYAPLIFIKSDVSLFEFIQTTIVHLDEKSITLRINGQPLFVSNYAINKYKSYIPPLGIDNNTKKVYISNSIGNDPVSLAFNKNIQDCYIIHRGSYNKDPYVINLLEKYLINIKEHNLSDLYCIAPQKFKYRIL